MFVTISLLLAAACLLPAAGKLLGHPKMRQSAAHFGIPWPRYRLIGAAELAAAAGILAGLWWHPLGIAAAAGMTVLLAGALITHRRAADSGKERAPALAALALTIAYLVIQAMSPSNVPLLNPSSAKAAIDTGGLSLVRGGLSLLRDKAAQSEQGSWWQGARLADGPGPLDRRLHRRQWSRHGPSGRKDHPERISGVRTQAVVKRALAGAAIYLVPPKLIAVLGAWPRRSGARGLAGYSWPSKRPVADRRNSTGRTSSPQRCMSPGPSGTPASSGA